MEQDIGPKGKKLSKSGDSERKQQEIRLLEKWHVAMVTWCRAVQSKDGTEDAAHADWMKVSDEYKRQFDYR